MGLGLYPYYRPWVRRARKRGIAYIASHTVGWRYPKHASQGPSRLGTYVHSICQAVGVIGEQTVQNAAPWGGSIPEPAGGVRRRFGEGRLTSHHLRKQPPGDGSERETVMGMAKGEP